jgi:hypothetical protein
MARAAVPAMPAAGWGRIADISKNNETVNTGTTRRAGFSRCGSSKAAAPTPRSSAAREAQVRTGRSWPDAPVPTRASDVSRSITRG